MIVKVSYTGSHNFDYDARLEAIAGQPRMDSSMDFEAMRRMMMFKFDTEEKCKLFEAAVANVFPEFNVSFSDYCAVEQSGSSPGS